MDPDWSARRGGRTWQPNGAAAACRRQRQRQGFAGTPGRGPFFLASVTHTVVGGFVFGERRRAPPEGSPPSSKGSSSCLCSSAQGPGHSLGLFAGVVPPSRPAGARLARAMHPRSLPPGTLYSFPCPCPPRESAEGGQCADWPTPPRCKRAQQITSPAVAPHEATTSRADRACTRSSFSFCPLSPPATGALPRRRGSIRGQRIGWRGTPRSWLVRAGKSGFGGGQEGESENGAGGLRREGSLHPGAFGGGVCLYPCGPGEHI